MVKAMVCEVAVSEFELQLRYYFHFRTNTNGERYEPSYPTSYELNSTITVFQGE